MIASSFAGLIKRPRQFHQSEALLALIDKYNQAPARGAHERLFMCINGQDRVAKRDRIAHRDIHHPVVGVVAHDIIVAGLTADHATKRDRARIFASRRCRCQQPRLDGGAQCLRDLKRTRHLDTIIARTGRVELSNRPFDQGTKYINKEVFK